MYGFTCFSPVTRLTRNRLTQPNTFDTPNCRYPLFGATQGDRAELVDTTCSKPVDRHYWKPGLYRIYAHSDDQTVYSRLRYSLLWTVKGPFLELPPMASRLLTFPGMSLTGSALEMAPTSSVPGVTTESAILAPANRIDFTPYPTERRSRFR